MNHHSSIQRTIPTSWAMATSSSLLHSRLSTHAENMWAQMQTNMLSMHCSLGVDGYWGLTVCWWCLANYALIMRGISLADLPSTQQLQKAVSQCVWLTPYVTTVSVTFREHCCHPSTILKWYFYIYRDSQTTSIWSFSKFSHIMSVNWLHATTSGQEVTGAGWTCCQWVYIYFLLPQG